MFVTDHAIRRYKQRVGKRTASKGRIFTQINRDLERDVKELKWSKVPKHYFLITSKYKAVCYKERVITICSLKENYEAVEDELEKIQLNELILI